MNPLESDLLSKLWLLGLERCTDISEDLGSNPVEAWKVFFYHAT